MTLLVLLLVLFRLAWSSQALPPSPPHPHTHLLAAGNGGGTLGGMPASPADKAFGVLSAMGTLAFACESYECGQALLVSCCA